jgi:dTDP-4-amino-4,6-dideoxygalactose transaminase
MSSQPASASNPIPFNRPDLSGNEAVYLKETLARKYLSGNGPFSQKCSAFFEQRYGIHKAFLTTSCTDALEMCALLLNLGPGDEVILPSFTFVSTANAFMLRGAELIFADSTADHPNVDLEQVEALVTDRTKVVVVVHYGGVACDMDRLKQITEPRGIKVVEDAAHAIDSYYKGKPLGTIGDLGTFSFHETKNLVAGEGGLLAVNDPALAHRAEILWEKGTNRCQFFRGEIDKYGWVDLGSSFLASELVAAVLWAQIERVEEIQSSRLQVWHRYLEIVQPGLDQGRVTTFSLPPYATNNAHLFALMCRDLEARTDLLNHLRARGVYATFHYQPLHSSPYFGDRYAGAPLPQVQRYADCLLRLPLFSGMTPEELETICAALKDYRSA